MSFIVGRLHEYDALEQTVRLEGDLVITDKGHELFTLFPFEEDMLK